MSTKVRIHKKHVLKRLHKISDFILKHFVKIFLSFTFLGFESMKLTNVIYLEKYRFVRI
jgi:hypothetical protein